MRLEPLCRVSMRYTDGEWMRPFGTAESAGFGWGKARSRRRPARSVRWTNYPRMREDGVWTPDLRGVIRTEDGAEVLSPFTGRACRRTPDDARRAILTRWSC